MGCSQTSQWFSRFKTGRTSIDDDERSGRPVSSSTPEMIETVRQIIREDRRRTFDKVSMLVRISHGTCHKILTEDLKMRRVASYIYLHLSNVLTTENIFYCSGKGVTVPGLPARSLPGGIASKRGQTKRRNTQINPYPANVENIVSS